MIWQGNETTGKGGLHTSKLMESTEFNVRLLSPSNMDCDMMGLWMLLAPAAASVAARSCSNKV